MLTYIWVLTALILSMLSMPNTRADNVLVPVTIIPNSEWLYWHANSVKCRKPIDVPFLMGAIGGKAKFTAHAEVCGDFDELQVLELLRLVKLADVAAKHNEPWRVSIAGNANAATVAFTIINDCNGNVDWLVGRRFDHWALWKPYPNLRMPCALDFVPVLLPQVVE